MEVDLADKIFPQPKSITKAKSSRDKKEKRERKLVVSDEALTTTNTSKVSDEALTTTKASKVSSNLDNHNYTCVSDLKTDPKKLRLIKMKSWHFL